MAATDVYGLIATYFQDLHENIIWPTLAPPPGRTGARGRKLLKPRPDALAEYKLLLMATYSKAAEVFDPVERRCTDNGDCDQDEECIKGVCTPISGSNASASARGCIDNGDCDQDEECIKGVCTPRPFDLTWAAVAEKPAYGTALNNAFEAYYSRIHAVIVTGLGKNPSKLAAIRDVLMQLYAGASKTAGAPTVCHANADCPEDWVCVDGVCVPIPYRLVFKPLRGSEPAPWT